MADTFTPFIVRPGIYSTTMDDYQRDPVAGAPSLSSGVACEILARSPMHGWARHPRNPAFVADEPEEKFDRGTAAHRYVLEGISGFVVVEADDWRKADAKAKRDEARAAGKLPMLRKYLDDVLAMASALDSFKLRFGPDRIPFSIGRAEAVLVWKEETRSGGIWCRARADFLHGIEVDVPRVVQLDFRLGGHRGALIDDYKTTGRSANPAEFVRAIYSMGYDVQEAHYRRGLARVLGIDLEAARFRFVVQENFRPFACSVVELDPASRALGDRKLQAAYEAWARGVNRGEWPGYPAATASVTVPPYIETAWIAREDAEIAAEGGF